MDQNLRQDSYDEDEIIVDDDTILTRPLLKYNHEAFEIHPVEYNPEKPHYYKKNTNYFYPMFSTSELVAQNADEQQHHHHHHPHGRTHSIGHHHYTHFRHFHSIQKDYRQSEGGRDSKEPNHGGSVENPASVLETRRTEEMLEVLHHYLPPVDFYDPVSKKYFRRPVSDHPSSVEEVNTLISNFEKRLEDRCASNKGYCPIRREIFTDCFDEILREVIIDNPLVGVILGKIRDEIRMTLTCWRRLTRSMDAYGTCKSTLYETSKNEVEALTSEADDAYQIIADLRKQEAALIFQIKKDDAEYSHQHEIEKKRRQQELQFFRHISMQLHEQMERVRANAKLA